MRVLLWITTVALVATSEAFAAPHGGGNYDGRWSVEVITDQGTCDRCIGGCSVFRAAASLISARSRDLLAGFRRMAVSIRFVRNRDYATATGRLSGDWGSGSWS